MNVIERIERGELLVMDVRECKYCYDDAEPDETAQAELIRLAKIGEFYDTLKNKDFDELMKRVDKPGKTLSLSDLNLLVGFAKIGQRMQWVPVTNKLPEIDQQILFIYNKKIECGYYLGYD